MMQNSIFTSTAEVILQHQQGTFYCFYFHLSYFSGVISHFVVATFTLVKDLVLLPPSLDITKILSYVKYDGQRMMDVYLPADGCRLKFRLEGFHEVQQLCDNP